MPNSLDAFMPEIWAKETQMIFDKSCVMKNLVSRKYEKDLSYGDTVHVQLAAKLTAASYTRNSTLSAQDITATDATLVVNQQRVVYFRTDLMDKKQSKIDIVKTYAERAGVAMAEVIDTRLLSHYTDPIAGNVIGSTGSPIALTAANIYDQFADAKYRLQAQNIPGELHVVIPPIVQKLINTSPELRDRSTGLADETIRNGYLGKFAGFNVHVSTNMAQVSSVWPIMFFHPEFIQYVEQALEVIPEGVVQGTLSEGYKTYGLYGSKVFNTEAGVTLYATA